MNHRAHQPEPDLTEEQLTLAVRQLRRPHWPATPEAVLAHPLHGPCVRGLARALSRAGLRAAAPAHTLPRPPAPPTPTRPPQRGAVPTAAIDCKRLAANDKEDPDDQ